MFIYKTQGTCSTEIHLDIEGTTIKSIEFVRGCAGNLLGIGSLVKGIQIDTAIEKLKGIDCKGRGTSCPDQLALALEEYKQQ